MKQSWHRDPVIMLAAVRALAFHLEMKFTAAYLAGDQAAAGYVDDPGVYDLLETYGPHLRLSTSPMNDLAFLIELECPASHRSPLSAFGPKTVSGIPESL